MRRERIDKRNFTRFYNPLLGIHMHAALPARNENYFIAVVKMRNVGKSHIAVTEIAYKQILVRVGGGFVISVFLRLFFHKNGGSFFALFFGFFFCRLAKVCSKAQRPAEKHFNIKKSRAQPVKRNRRFLCYDF